MKLLVAFTALTLGLATQSQAAFVIKKAPVKTEQVANANTTAGAADENATASATTTNAATETKSVKKHSFLHRLFARAEGKAEISQGAYIVLSIFFLGWLAIGLNDGFEGFSWILDLILYILFWLPGFVYALLVMGNYY